MSFNRKTYTLNDVCLKITDGAHQSPKSVDVGMPMCSVKDLTEFGLTLETARQISEGDYQKLVRQGCMPSVGDVLIAKDGNSALDTACTVATEVETVLLSSVAILRPNPELLDSDYLKYWFKSKRTIDYLKSNFISGAAIPRVVLKDFKKAEISLPPLDQQRSASQILRALDNRIQLNHQINQTLEQMAQAIFKSWFVDFEPVKAKIAALEAGGSEEDALLAAMQAISGKGEAELTRLQAEQPEQFAELRATAELFPSAMQDSELGAIPEGWSALPLYDTAEYVNGAAFKAKDFSESGSGLPIIKIAELKQGITAGTKYTNAEVKDKYRITDGSVLYSWSGSPETSLEVFKWFGGEGWLNQHIFKLNFTKGQREHFTYFLLKQMKPLLVRTAQQKQTTGLGHITVADMKRIKIPYPSPELLSAFSENIEPLYSRSSNAVRESKTLADLRDTLLPKLLSGELSATRVEPHTMEAVEIAHV